MWLAGWLAARPRARAPAIAVSALLMAFFICILTFASQHTGKEKRARKGNTFYGCGNYPNCKFTSAHKPIPEKCPTCGNEYLVEKFLKAGPVIACPNKECDYDRPNPAAEAAATTA